MEHYLRSDGGPASCKVLFEDDGQDVVAQLLIDGVVLEDGRAKHPLQRLESCEEIVTGHWPVLRFGVERQLAVAKALMLDKVFDEASLPHPKEDAEDFRVVLCERFDLHRRVVRPQGAQDFFEIGGSEILFHLDVWNEVCRRCFSDGKR